VFDNVVIGVDGRSGGRAAVALAGQLAAPGARITFAHVYAGEGMVGRGARLGVVLERQAAEREIAGERAASSLDAGLSLITASTVSRGLHELAESRNADLLVVGSCHRGPIGRVLAGNDAVATLNGSPCAVAIAPAGYEDRSSKLSTLGVGENASPEGALGLEVAIALGHGLAAAVRVWSIVSLQDLPPGEIDPSDWQKTTERLVQEEKHRLERIPGIESEVTYGEPGDELLRLSEDVDLMVVGSRGHGPFGRLMNGSTSNYLAQRVHCPLLVVPRPKVVEAGKSQPTLTARG
jgi:nucleotide-binding universal stress UspA family protein